MPDLKNTTSEDLAKYLNSALSNSSNSTRDRKLASFRKFFDWLRSEGLTSTNPVLVNPTKTAATGTQDSWTIRLRTNDSGSVEIDNKKRAVT